jgi:hypothetical protein
VRKCPTTRLCHATSPVLEPGGLRALHRSSLPPKLVKKGLRIASAAREPPAQAHRMFEPPRQCAVGVDTEYIVPIHAHPSWTCRRPGRPTALRRTVSSTSQPLRRSHLNMLSSTVVRASASPASSYPGPGLRCVWSFRQHFPVNHHWLFPGMLQENVPDISKRTRRSNCFQTGGMVGSPAPYRQPAHNPVVRALPGRPRPGRRPVRRRAGGCGGGEQAGVHGLRQHLTAAGGSGGADARVLLTFCQRPRRLDERGAIGGP